MVILPRQCLLLLAAVSSVLSLCQCETKRTYGEVRRGSVKFADQGRDVSDEKEIRSKFAERGYTVAEDGTLVADKPNLYADDKAKGLDGAFGKKQAKLRKDQAATKEFRTPEYVKRQTYRGYEESRYGDTDAREGNFNRSRDDDSGRLFNTRKKTDSTNQLSEFNTGSYRESGNTFATNPDRRGTSARNNVLDAQGSPFQAGYQDSALSMDDVKQMLNPAAYARANDLD